jgi:hypothetical protein
MVHWGRERIAAWVSTGRASKLAPVARRPAARAEGLLAPVAVVALGMGSGGRRDFR